MARQRNLTPESQMPSHGRLKLKGGLTIKGGKIKKAKKRRKNTTDLVEVPSGAQQVTETSEGYVLPPPAEEEDRRTPAEKRYEERVIQREVEKAKTQVLKSHREKVRDFNEYLAHLTEHHDIPKVGPG